MSLGLQSVYQLDVILCFEVFAAILVELEFSCAAFALNCVFPPGGMFTAWLSWTPGTSIVVASHCDVTIAFLLRDWSIHCQDAQRHQKTWIFRGSGGSTIIITIINVQKSILYLSFLAPVHRE